MNVAYAPRDVAARFSRAALLYFVVVGILGTWLRARFVGLMPLSLQPANVIHAHSHVAFFGWASVALFGGIYYVLPQLTGRPLTGVSVIRWQLRLIHVSTIGALITFAAGGYTPASIVFSTLNGLLWYVFVWVYWKNVTDLPRPLPVPLRYLHVAVTLLVLSSTGTWLVSAVTATGMDAPLLEAAGLHLFLNNFIDGWLVIGLLGLTTFVLSSSRADDAASGESEWATRPLVAIAVLTPVSFLADLAQAGLPMAWASVGVAARTALAVPYTLFFVRAARRFRELGQAASMSAPDDRKPTAAPAVSNVYWLAAALFFAGKIVSHAASAAAVIVPSRQLFIAYLHLNLLGFFSCGALALLAGLAVAPRFGAERAADVHSVPVHRSGSALTAVSALVVAIGVAGMVVALFGAAAADTVWRTGDRVLVERLLQAAFVFAGVSLVGMGAASLDVWRRWGNEGISSGAK